MWDLFIYFKDKCYLFILRLLGLYGAFNFLRKPQ